MYNSYKQVRRKRRQTDNQSCEQAFNRSSSEQRAGSNATIFAGSEATFMQQCSTTYKRSIAVRGEVQAAGQQRSNNNISC
jgi:hypothetical protein